MNLFKKNGNTEKSSVKNDIKSSFKTTTFKMGGYSVLLTAIVIVLVVIVNIVVGAMPSSITGIDTTSEELFTISGQTKDIVDSLEEEVNLYYIAEEGNEQAVVEELLEKYDDLSDKVTVKQIDPAVDPGFTAAYTDGAMTSNSVIVESEKRFKIVDYNDIIVTEYDYSTYYTTGSVGETYSFAGENAITGAIDYVTSDDLPTIYNLIGHGESTLTDTMKGYINTDNIEINDLSLISESTIPEDADAILINTPTSDISADEADIIIEYLEDGGKLMLVTGFSYDPDTAKELSFKNLMSVTKTYGCTLEEGIVCEEDSSHFYQAQTYLLPDIGSHEITAPMIENGSYVLAPIAQGINISDDIRGSVTVTKLLTTSDNSYAEQDITSSSTSKGDEDKGGPFTLAVAIEEEYDDVNTKIVWMSCSYILDDSMDSYVSGGNSDFFRNSLAWLAGREDSISIRAKSLSSSALTVPANSAYITMAITIIVLPLSIIIAGLIIWLRRRKR